MNTMYWEIIISDTNNLAGTTVQNMLEYLQVLNESRMRFVVVDSIEGAGITGFGTSFPLLMTYKECLSECAKVSQFDWGDFYCFFDMPRDFKGESYPERISVSVVTIRAVDSSELYIYTPSEGIRDKIIAGYTVREINQERLEDFVFPF